MASEDGLILRMEAGERYLLNRIDSLAVELLAVDHPWVRDDDIVIDEDRNAIVLFDIFFDDTRGFRPHTLNTSSGQRSLHARQMLESRLIIGPAAAIERSGNSGSAPPIFEGMRMEKGRLTIEMLGSQEITIVLNENPLAVLEITDRIGAYLVQQGVLQTIIRDPESEL